MAVNAVSKKKIEEMVDNLLKNQVVNNRFLPDVVERQIYINAIEMTLGLLETATANLEVHFLGYRARLVIDPEPAPVPEPPKPTPKAAATAEVKE